MSEKLFKSQCSIHGSLPCEVFVEKEKKNKVRKRCSKKRRQIAKNEIDEWLKEN